MNRREKQRKQIKEYKEKASIKNRRWCKGE